MFVARSYEAGGYRRESLELVRASLRAHVPDPKGARFEVSELARLRAFHRFTEQVPAASADTDARDRTLAVLADHRDDDRFLTWVVERRREHQRGQLCELRRHLVEASGLSNVLNEYARWVRTGERRLRVLAVRELGPCVWKHFQSRAVGRFGEAAPWLYVVPLLVAYFAAIPLRGTDPLDVISAAALTVPVMYLAVAWGPSLVRAVETQFQETPRAYVRAFYWSLAGMFAMAVTMTTLLMLGVMERLWVGGDAALEKAIGELDPSPQLAAGIGLLMMDGLLGWMALGSVRDALDRRAVAWDRVRAAGKVAAWSCLVPPLCQARLRR